MRRAWLYVGLAFVLVGAMLTIVPTASFSTIAGDRPVDVSVADDSAAFVAVSNTNTPVSQPENSVAVAELVNNLDGAMTIEFEASIDSSTVAVETPSDTATVQQGGRHPIYAACSPPNGGSGTATLQIDVIEARGGSATVTDATLETLVEYDCPGKGGGGGPGGPSGPPGGAVAYVDENGNHAYDEGERTVTRNELAEFDDDSAALVIAADGRRVQFGNREVDIAARSIAVGDGSLSSNREVTLEADGGTLSMSGSTIESQNGAIELSGSEVTASDATVATNEEISVNAGSGALSIGDSTIESSNGEIELSGRSIDAPRTTVRTNEAISLDADSGSVGLSEATIESQNGAIDIGGSNIDASKAAISTNTEISLAADGGELTLTDATVDSTNGEIDLAGGSIQAAGASISTDVGIGLTAESGTLQLGEASVTSSNGELEIESAADILASGAAFETNVGIAFSASGDVLLDAARVASSNGQAEVALGVESATLSVDRATLDDRDGTLTYDPSGVTVEGTPARGSVQAG
ncbi:DUF4097 domain-containing protein [Halobellus captivus]|uniref:DUF4097 domain-containing protein n=1 Tax=Halobellus captivus TaxID=2592614 RepID=UPI0011A08A52|nr:DUF4097 domain-containing protein [Halobellus captivus]